MDHSPVTPHHKKTLMIFQSCDCCQKGRVKTEIKFPKVIFKVLKVAKTSALIIRLKAKTMKAQRTIRLVYCSLISLSLDLRIPGLILVTVLYLL